MPFFINKLTQDVYEARQYVGSPDDDAALLAWCKGRIEGSRLLPAGESGGAWVGDWILRAANGTVWSCAAKKFEASYEPAPPDVTRADDGTGVSW